MNRQQVMGFLNEVAIEFPNAISLAAGRPKPQFFYPDKFPQYQQRFVEHLVGNRQMSEQQAWASLCEYGPSEGIINDILAKHLACDEQIEATAEQFIVSNGFQEALSLYCLHRLVNENDVILTLDPAYIGLSAIVESVHRQVVAVSFDSVQQQGRFNWAGLADKVAQLKAQGLNPVAIYVNPDFNNPLAYHLDFDARVQLLEVCYDCGLEVVEDSPYGRFDYSDEARQLSLRALDKHDIVYYIGSFAKTFCPGVRVGFILVPNNSQDSAAALKSLKGAVSVNTSGLTQAIVGGFLLTQQYSLEQHLAPIIAQYAKQRDALEQALNCYLGEIAGVEIHVPSGGYFARLALPFEITCDDVFSCAKDFGVIFMPLGFFSVEPEVWAKTIRLSFSYYEPQQIEQGVARLAQWITTRLDVNN